MDLNDVVFKALFDWVKAVLPSDKIAAENDGNAKVSGICLGVAYDLEPQGRPHYGPVVAGERAITQDYSGEAVIWEVGSNGDKLRVLQESLAKQTTILLLQARGISIRYMQKPQDVSQIIGNRWIKEHRAVAVLSVRTRTYETIGTIETVESTLEVQ